MEGHDVPPDVLADVVHWLQKSCVDEQSYVSDPSPGANPTIQERIIFSLDMPRSTARDGAPFCRNDGCQVVGQLKDFRVCPQCKSARYCGKACQTEDWTTGGHKATCGTFRGGSKVGQRE
jgi:hypothetical protein